MQLGFTQIRASANRARMAAVSPHLDDVVLSCAGLVAAHPGALVVTVTAGKPPAHPLTGWDLACGFAQGDDAIGARRREDEEALHALGARPAWLDFLDRQYAGGSSPAPAAVADAIEEVLARDGCDLVASPLGLQHPDHLATAAACFELAGRMPAMPWLVYEDAIYRADPGATDEAIRSLAQRGFALEPVSVPSAGRKRAAIGCYASQLRGLGDLVADAYRPERYWTLVRQP
jgi:LmbE family N-acetylglucosaminyl deacetylase